MAIYYVNGAYVPEEQAVLPARDLAVLRGYGAFDLLRTYGGHPFRLEKNLARLRRSCDVIELSLPWSDEELSAIIRETLNRNLQAQTDYIIRVIVTGGVSSDNITPDGQPSLIVMVNPVRPNNPELYQKGAKVVTVELSRLFPSAKSTIYTGAIIAQKRARQAGGVEALYIDENGNVTEGTTTNLFAFYGNKLVTPPEGELLSGITRLTVIELAKTQFEVEVRPLTLAELLQADEVFISASTKEVLPIVQVDDHMIGDGKVGEGTQQMMSLFRALTDERAQGLQV